MSNVAAVQPGGRERMRAEAAEKVPHSVGKSSELMKKFTEGVSGLLRGKERYCTGRNEAELGFGTRPRGEVRKGPIKPSSSPGSKAREYRPAACSLVMYEEMKDGL